MSRTVAGQHVFRSTDKEVLRRMIWQIADYCGVQILTYAILINHFHLVVRVPQLQPVSDAELLRRYERLHPPSTAWCTLRLAVIKRDLEKNGEKAAQFRARQLALMGDISPFMQLLKQRFATWFNRSHNRYGTLWAERYTSVLLEGRGPTVRRCMRYVDLNAVHSGSTQDPKDYRFCGYAEAVAGNHQAREGILSAFGQDHWETFHGIYRRSLFAEAARPRRKGAVLPESVVQPVVKAEGTISVSEMIRCRLRYLSDSVVLGSRAFVAEQLARFRERTSRGRRMIPNPLPLEAGWPTLTSFRRLTAASPGANSGP